MNSFSPNGYGNDTLDDIDSLPNIADAPTVTREQSGALSVIQNTKQELK